MNLHIDTKVKTIIARERAFENSTLRQLSQFERLQMKTAMSNEMNSKATLVVHQADSVSDKRRDKKRDKERERSRDRERRNREREREQAAISKKI
jgi:hypothetical protein